VSTRAGLRCRVAAKKSCCKSIRSRIQICSSRLREHLWILTPPLTPLRSSAGLRLHISGFNILHSSIRAVLWGASACASAEVPAPRSRHRRNTATASGTSGGPRPVAGARRRFGAHEPNKSIHSFKRTMWVCGGDKDEAKQQIQLLPRRPHRRRIHRYFSPDPPSLLPNSLIYQLTFVLPYLLASVLQKLLRDVAK
jgi:hypothetical protein